jgi:hypothetical protein
MMKIKTFFDVHKVRIFIYATCTKYYFFCKWEVYTNERSDYIL